IKELSEIINRISIIVPKIEKFLSKHSENNEKPTDEILSEKIDAPDKQDKDFEKKLEDLSSKIDFLYEMLSKF
ncbi:MAG: hypothetical protein HQK76_21115, partial [Desulfobacterales bacterium]|nr:hypothetical protein [Desulfobacterales bacterium]